MRLRNNHSALIIACILASGASAQIAGFGTTSSPSQVPGFDGSQAKSEKPEQSTSAAPTSERPRERPRRGENNDRPQREQRRASASSKNQPRQSLAAQTDGYVRSLMDEHDKNHDRRLDSDELKSLPGNLAKADGNKDQVITFEELRAHVLALNTNSASGTTASTNRPPAIQPPSSRNSDRKASRTERKRVELPGRFKSRDQDGDGQVAMSEYSLSWTDSLAAEFRRYDKNNDGVITAREAL